MAKSSKLPKVLIRVRRDEITINSDTLMEAVILEEESNLAIREDVVLSKRLVEKTFIRADQEE